MRWVVRGELGEGAARYIRDWAAQFDLLRLRSFYLSESKKQSKKPGISGYCWHPGCRGNEGKTYKITCRVDIRVFPYELTTRRPPLYRNADGSWPPVPDGCTLGGWVQIRDNGKVKKEWRRLVSLTIINDSGEGAVWVTAHEFYHFLRRDRQVGGRNDEIRADQFADDILAQYRQGVLEIPKHWRI